MEKYADFEAMQAALEARAADDKKGAALRQMKQIMIRIMKGEAAFRLEVWRQLKKMDKYAEFESMQAALEAQMQAQGQNAGLRMLRQILMRMVRAKRVWRLRCGALR